MYFLLEVFELEREVSVGDLADGAERGRDPVGEGVDHLIVGL